MKQAVICFVATEVKAESIVDMLKTAGFLNTVISVLMPDRSGVRDLGTEKRIKAPQGTSAGVA